MFHITLPYPWCQCDFITYRFFVINQLLNLKKAQEKQKRSTCLIITCIYLDRLS